MYQVYKRLISAVMILVLMCSCLAAVAEDQDIEAFNQKVNKVLKGANATGAALLIAKDGEVVYEHYYGYAIRSKQVPVTADTWFRVASVSKMISAIGVMTYVEEGKLDLDADISEYLGYKVRNTRFKKEDLPITLRMIMTHTSSIYDGGGYSSGKTSLQYMLDAANGRFANFTKKKPGEAYRYSNLSGGMLGVLMECASGKSVISAMKERVFEPLGLNATMDIQYITDRDNVSFAYDKSKKLKQGVQILSTLSYKDEYDPDKHFRISAAKVWIKAPDLLKIGMMLEQGGTLGDVTILKPETVAEMCSDQKGKGGITADSLYGLNINRNETLVKGRMIYGHQGMNDGLLANVFFDPESHFVFAFVSNGINNAQSSHVAKVSRSLFNMTWERFNKDN